MNSEPNQSPFQSASNTTTFKSSIGRFGILISFALIIITIVLSIIFQHYVSNKITSDRWTYDCGSDYEEECKANSAVYRFSFALVIIFLAQACLTFVSINSYDDFWIVKIIAYVGILVGFYFVRANIFDDHGFAWAARIIAGLFVVFQQIILIDAAYNWNEKWVEYSSGSENFSFWLMGLIFFSGILFGISFSAVGIMYWQFHGCAATETVLSITLCLIVVATVVQVSMSSNGSLITSAIVTAYCTYLTYSSVSLYPEHKCNPTISTKYQTLSEVWTSSPRIAL